MSKKYHIYGLGNALVDIVTEVDDDFFRNHQVKKGVMTLVDETRQYQLFEAIHLPDSERQCGGSAANTIISASQFGSRCFYSCKIANDEMGLFYLQDLIANRIDTNLNGDGLDEGITGKCLVMTTLDAQRTMNTFLGITSNFSVKELDEQAISESQYIYIEGYLITSENGRQAMKAAKAMAEKHGIKTALTLSDPSIVQHFKKEMEEVVGDGVDLLFCNEEEACLFTDTNNILEARERLKYSAKKFAITLGANGASIFDGDTFVDIEPYRVQAVDTNGAGDMFAGAFLFGITHGHTCAESGKIASLASSKVVSKFGPRLNIEQIQEILETLFKVED
ncbi:adenosine kinase [Fulvivirgaceae bacterium BMA12]|uniref:Adenosine kinase n=1 Tax=Agaribacillus aureus TaxID=3051825 RepID=A0ABT8LGA4_9BACT|nr:adenosine kinase [Fulvivirgaceae bacterium BMA12]